jgi:flagellin
MSLNSVNTNMGAMIALQSLNKTNTDLQATEKRISTGYRVADATDDGAAFAVAQKVRSDTGALTTVNQQLGGVKSLVSTTVTQLTTVSNTMVDMKKTLVQLADSNVTGDTRTQYLAQYKSQMASVKSAIQDGGYNGKTLIGNITGSGGSFSSVTSVRNESGGTFGVGSYDGSALYGSVAGLSTVTTTLALGALTAGGTFTKMLASVGTALNTYGNASTYIDNQTKANSAKIDSLNSGLGYLVDADLTKEAANLQSLQTRQQLAQQSLQLANQAPNSLVSLFR